MPLKSAIQLHVKSHQHSHRSPASYSAPATAPPNVPALSYDHPAVSGYAGARADRNTRGLVSRRVSGERWNHWTIPSWFSLPALVQHGSALFWRSLLRSSVFLPHYPISEMHRRRSMSRTGREGRIKTQTKLAPQNNSLTAIRPVCSLSNDTRRVLWSFPIIRDCLLENQENNLKGRRQNGQKYRNKRNENGKTRTNINQIKSINRTKHQGPLCSLVALWEKPSSYRWCFKGAVASFSHACSGTL